MGFVPFPGDLLLAEYQPWRTYSFAGYNPGSVPNKAQYFDPLRQMYPWKTLALASLKNGDIPLWNPYNFSGSPLFANFQSALLFPLNIFYAFLPQTKAWTLLVLFQPLLCLFATYALGRHYGFSKFAAMLSSISYSFCLYMTTFLEYNILGHYLWILPIGLYGIEKLISGNKKGVIFLSLSVILASFSGHVQLFGITCLYLASYLTLRGLTSETFVIPRYVYVGFLFIFLGIGIGSVQLIPTIELIFNAARVAHSELFVFSDLLIHLDKIILYLVPDIFGNPATKNYLLPFSYPSKALYVGISTLLFVIVSFWIKKKNSQQKTLLILTTITFCGIFFTPISWIFTKLEIPFFNSSSPSNALYLLSFGLCMLAGFGAQTFVSMLSKKFIFVPLVFLLFIGSYVGWLIYADIPFRINNVLYSVLVVTLTGGFFILTIIFQKKQTLWLLLIICITSADLFYFFQKFNPFVPDSYLYPQTAITTWLKEHASINRYWGYGLANIEANFATQLNIYSPDGYDPLYPKEYGKLVVSSYEGKFPTVLNRFSRSDATIPPGFGQTGMMENPYRLKLLSVLGVLYILDKTDNGSTGQTFDPKYFTYLQTIGDFHILTYNRAAPRYFFTTQYDTYNNDTEFISKLYSQSFDPITSVLLATRPSFKSSDTQNNTIVELIEYSEEKSLLRVQADRQGILYLSDTYYPGWQATIDGKTVPILKANYAFRAVEVPTGTHIISFTYKPFSVILGVSISLSCICITFFVYRFFNFSSNGILIRRSYSKKI